MYKLLLEKYDQVIRALDEQLDNFNEDRMDEGAFADDDAAKEDKEHQWKHPAEKAKNELHSYLKELPVLELNSDKYDVNLMKKYLQAELKRVDPLKFIVKRTSTYMVIKTDLLKFLDITNYLAPGYSYSKVLRA